MLGSVEVGAVVPSSYQTAISDIPAVMEQALETALGTCGGPRRAGPGASSGLPSAGQARGSPNEPEAFADYFAARPRAARLPARPLCLAIPAIGPDSRSNCLRRFVREMR